MYSKFLVSNKGGTVYSKPSDQQGFLVIELLIGLLLVSVSTLGLWALLSHSRALTQQAEWYYQATLSASNSLNSHLFSKEPIAAVEWQAWLAEAFPNSRILLEKNKEKVLIKCLPPPHSHLKVIELESSRYTHSE